MECDLHRRRVRVVPSPVPSLDGYSGDEGRWLPLPTFLTSPWGRILRPTGAFEIRASLHPIDTIRRNCTRCELFSRSSQQPW